MKNSGSYVQRLSMELNFKFKLHVKENFDFEHKQQSCLNLLPNKWS